MLRNTSQVYQRSRKLRAKSNRTFQHSSTAYLHGNRLRIREQSSRHKPGTGRQIGYCHEEPEGHFNACSLLVSRRRVRLYEGQPLVLEGRAGPLALSGHANASKYSVVGKTAKSHLMGFSLARHAIQAKLAHLIRPIPQFRAFSPSFTPR